jgi:cellulose synthase (UDP-forming)
MATAVKGSGSAHGATARHRRADPAAALELPRSAPEAPARQSGGSPVRSAAPRKPESSSPALILPVPPYDNEKYAYVNRRAWVLTVCSAVCFPCLLLSQVFLIERYPWFWGYAPFVLLGVGLFMLPLLTDGMSKGFDLEDHLRIVREWRPDRYPSVDVFLPVCGEPADVLRNTWHYVALLRMSYRGKVTPYVLDDSASPELQRMAREFDFAYAVRPNRGWLKKSGNLLFGYQVSDGDFVLLLDADFAPRHDLLDETLPYMDAFPQIGIVQTPQYFHVSERQTWVERGAGAVQELFYRSIQTARARKDGATCVGSCAVYRRAALDDNGGMSLSEHSEDLRTGFDLYRLGWQLCYLPVALSTGTCPDNALAFLNQQYRWCSGCITLLSEKLFWKSKLGLYTRLCYVSGFVYYLYTAVFTFVVPALSVAILLFFPNILKIQNTVFILPIILYAYVIYPMWHRLPYRLEAWSVRVISGWAHLFAFWDLATGKRRGWQPSGTSVTKQDGRRRFWVGAIAWSGGSAAAWVGLSLWRLMTMNPDNVVLMLVMGLFEATVVARMLVSPRVGTS